ncbi:MAG: DUF2066 domain-containing protein [Stellaceae bacterium]
MILARLSAIAGSRAGRRAAGAGLLLMTMLIGLAPGWADDTNPAPANPASTTANPSAAPANPYSATVKVDATADTAVAARTQARLDGQRRALAKVVANLSGSTDLSKMPKLSDQAITDMVTNFEVANEKMSAVRYLADYTFNFRAAKIRQLMHSAGIAIAQPPGKPVIIVPVFEDGGKGVLWDDPNPWRAAWAQLPGTPGPTQLSLPLGGLGDVSAIDAEQARDGDPQALTAIAQGNGGDEALVAMATAQRQGGQLTGLDISLKRYRGGQLVNSQRTTIAANPGESPDAFMQRAAAAAAADIEHGVPSASNKVASLDAVVPIASLGDWVEMQQRLAAVPAIRKIDLLSLSRQRAKIEIKYVGSPDQLKSSLAEADLDLDGGDPEWRLSPSDAAGSH